MRKIVAGLFISLDGVVEAPDQWHIPYFNEEMGEAIAAQTAASDTMLFGRRTYEEFAAYWPHQQGGDAEFAHHAELAEHLNNTPKLVVSTTLKSAEWRNSTLISGNVVEELTRIKEQPGRDIAVTGSGTLVRWLLREGLLDRLNLLLHPIVVGSGGRLFADDGPPRPLKLAGSRTFTTGVLYLTYEPERA